MEDKEAIDLIEANLPWANSIAAGYASSIRHVDSEDIKQEAALALTLAAKTFDPSYNVSFQAYAHRCIKNRLDSLYRSGQRKQAHEQALPDVTASAEQAEGDSPTDELPSQEADAATEAHRNEVRQALLAGAAQLTPNQREILTAFVHGESYQKIASRLGSSRQAVQQAANRAWVQMRISLEGKGHRNAAFMPRVGPPKGSPSCMACLLILLGGVILALVIAALRH